MPRTKRASRFSYRDRKEYDRQRRQKTVVDSNALLNKSYDQRAMKNRSCEAKVSEGTRFAVSEQGSECTYTSAVHYHDTLEDSVESSTHAGVVDNCITDRLGGKKRQFSYSDNTCLLDSEAPNKRRRISGTHYETHLQTISTTKCPPDSRSADITVRVALAPEAHKNALTSSINEDNCMLRRSPGHSEWEDEHSKTAIRLYKRHIPSRVLRRPSRNFTSSTVSHSGSVARFLARAAQSKFNARKRQIASFVLNMQKKNRWLKNARSKRIGHVNVLTKKVSLRALYHSQATIVLQTADALLARSTGIAKSLGKKFQDKCTLLCGKLENSPSKDITRDVIHFVVQGDLKHTVYTEPYFWEVSRTVPDKQFKANSVFSVDTEGVCYCMSKVIATTPQNEYREQENESKLTSWVYDSLCVLRKYSLEGVAQFIHGASRVAENNLEEYVLTVNQCTNRFGTERAGHSNFCLDGTICSSPLRRVREVSCHFTALRSLLSNDFYPYLRFAKTHQALHEALNKIDFSTFYNAVENLKGVLRAYYKTKHVDLDSIRLLDDHDVQIQISLVSDDAVRNQHAVQIANFLKDLDEENEVSCCCCERFYTKKHARKLSTLRNRNEFTNSACLSLADYLLRKHGCDSLDDLPERYSSWYICEYCYYCLIQDTVPLRSAMNGLEFDDIPQELAVLNSFERILIQLTKSFKTVIRLGTVSGNRPTFSQLPALKGRVIYLTLPLQDNTNMLPQQLSLGGRLRILVNGVVTKDRKIWRTVVDMAKVRAALVKLKEINHLFHTLDIPTIEQMENEAFLGEEDDIAEICGEDLRLIEQPNALLRELTDEEVHEAVPLAESVRRGWHDNVTICDIDPVLKGSSLQTYVMKRVSGKPLDHRALHVDVKSYPVEFPTGRFGRHWERTKIRDDEFRKSRLDNIDGRLRNNIQYIFDSVEHYQTEQLISNVKHMMTQQRGMAVSVKSIIQKLELNDREVEANISSFMRNIRGTAAYWSKVFGELCAMMADRGPPTWFVTLSSAEYEWSDARDFILHRNVHTEPSLVAKTNAEICVTHPVDVTTFFQRRFRSFFNNFILAKENAVLGQVEDYYWRLEYQSRGSPHVHMLLWIKEAPVIGSDSHNAIMSFVTSHATCSVPNATESPILHDLVLRFQMHRHNAYCMRTRCLHVRRGGEIWHSYSRQCRFGFPRQITEVPVLHNAEVITRRKVKGKRGNRLYDFPRQQAEVSVNDYNPAMLMAWRANCDVQYIGEKSMAIARYVTGYVTKSEKSDMNDTFQELADKPAYARLLQLGSKAFNKREMGAYEAADLLLGHALYEKSCTVAFLNTFPADRRQRTLLPYSKLQTLNEIDDSSTDIFRKCLLDDYYPNRPDNLQSVCLYDFFRCYIVHSTENKSSSGWLPLKKKLGYVSMRGKPIEVQHAIHDPRKSVEQKELYYHSLLIMFDPWRDEQTILGNFLTYEAAFLNKGEKLRDMMSYHHKLQDIQDALELAKRNLEQDSDSDETGEQDCPSHKDNLQRDDFFLPLKEVQLELTDKARTNIAQNIDVQIDTLNTDQRRVFEKVTNHLVSTKTRRNLTLFVSGFGGTGKSHLVQTLTDWIIVRFPTKPGEPSPVIRSAPTGLAAFSIGGLTLHRLLALPVEHSKLPKYAILPNSKRHMLRTMFANLKLLIVDEISMVSSVTLAMIHRRLVEISGQEQPYGGYNILLLGDLLQLPPVQGNPVFMQVTRDERKAVFASAFACHLWLLFEYDELTINVRQQHDTHYASLLSRVRQGEVTDADRQTLRQRILSKPRLQTKVSAENIADLYTELSKKGQRPVCLLPTNDLCNTVNLTLLNLEEEQIITIPSLDSFASSIPENKRESYLKKLKQKNTKISDTAGLENSLTISKVARVMLRRNVCMEQGLVNGAMGTVHRIVRKADGFVLSIVIVFDSMENYYSLDRELVRFEVAKNIYCDRKQFPITLAYAITIHKCQGLSLSCVIADLGNTCFGAGMHYVALSRVTSLNGLHLLAFDDQKLQADCKAIHEYNRLRALYRPDLPAINITEKYGKNFTSTKTTTNSTDGKDEEEGGTASTPQTEHAPIRQQVTNLQRLENPPYKTPPALQNNDGVSCYANVTVQVLLNIPELEHHFLTRTPNEHFDTERALSSFFVNKTTPDSSVRALRLAVDQDMNKRGLSGRFHLTEQQDAA